GFRIDERSVDNLAIAPERRRPVFRQVFDRQPGNLGHRCSAKIEVDRYAFANVDNARGVISKQEQIRRLADQNVLLCQCRSSSAKCEKEHTGQQSYERVTSHSPITPSVVLLWFDRGSLKLGLNGAIVPIWTYRKKT